MSLVGSRIKRIQPSATVVVAQRARDLKAAGRDVIDLAEGEPDFDTPVPIVEAAIAAMRRGETRYTAVDGTPALKAAIAAKFARENGLAFAPDQISVGTGAKQVIYNALQVSVEAGDEVVIPTPSWVSYGDMVTLAGGAPVLVPCRAEERFLLRAKALERALTPATRWLILNSPNNPTGSVYRARDYAALAAVLRRWPRVGVLADDIYEHLLYTDEPFVTFAAAAPDLASRTLTVNGVSKAYAMTGWRIGYGGGPADLIRAMATLQGQSTTNPSAIGQAAALAALSGPQEVVRERAGIMRARRDRVVELIRGVNGLACAVPEGAFYVFVDCAPFIGRRSPAGGVIASDADLAAHLVEAAGVALVPGGAFGASPYLRLCYAHPVATLEDALARIARALAALA